MTAPAQLPDGGLAAARARVAEGRRRVPGASGHVPAASASPAAAPVPPVGRADLARIARSWTSGPETGRFNASPEFARLCAVVEGLLAGHSASPPAGEGDAVKAAARLIMAQLAHVHGLAPAAVVLAAAGRPAPVPDPFPPVGEQVTVPLEALVTLLAEMDAWVEGGLAESAFRIVSAAAGVA